MADAVAREREASGSDVTWRGLARALLALTRRRLALAWLLSTVEVLAGLVAPLLLQRLLVRIGSPAGALDTVGVLLVVGLLCAQLCAAVARAQGTGGGGARHADAHHCLAAWFTMEQARNHGLVYVQKLVFAQSLQLSSVPKGLSATVHNVDPGRIGTAAYLIPRVPVIVINLVLSFVLLASFLGVAAAGALAVALLLVPANFYSIRVLNRVSSSIMRVQDERVNKLTEILEGMLLVKVRA